ncbi:MAG: class I tRNA ligase family protein [Candidatus Marinimicrobia bacterium]|nr:class I tRNA ligase family protein [Candidatus Neomarinimicrobiota bacterium]
MKYSKIPKQAAESFVKILYPFAPHICEELWEIIGHTNTITFEQWPTYDQNLIVEEMVTIAVQVNGKLRGNFQIEIDSNDNEIKKAAMEIENVKRHIGNREMKKIIIIKNKLVNFVV